jgi:hypothetical protein
VSRPKPYCQSIFPWLKANLGTRCLAPFTSQDFAAFQAAVQIAELWARSDYESRAAAAQAFGLVVQQMQEKVRYFAFHSVAHVADWGHRWQLWREAELSMEAIKGVPECKFGPKPAPKPAPASA